MRHGTSNRRQRGRGGNSRGGNPRSQVFDSNGPDVRIRGTAHQIVEKYQALAKDAASSGDRILAESYLQHAEHYQRVISSWGESVRPSKPAEAEKGKQEADKDEVYASKPSKEKEDLSLPASILGAEVKASNEESKDERTAEAGAA